MEVMLANGKRFPVYNDDERHELNMAVANVRSMTEQDMLSRLLEEDYDA